MDDLISRQTAIDELNKMKIYRPLDSDRYVISDCLNKIINLPSAQPERLPDDDIETIRGHLSAIKETLCNQHRWNEAKEYEQLLERFMAFASAQPEPPK